MTEDDMMETKTELTKRSDSQAVEKVFHVDAETLPVALAAAITELARLANKMTPDDISVSLDLPAGVMSFRAYHRAPAMRIKRVPTGITRLVGARRPRRRSSPA